MLFSNTLQYWNHFNVCKGVKWNRIIGAKIEILEIL